MESPDLRWLGMMPSVLDRIIDPSSLGTKAAPGFSIADLVSSVRRDVEELLNTRQNQDPEIDNYPLLANSVYRFGLPEVIGLRASSQEDRTKIARMIELAVMRNEPRLTNVKAVLVVQEKTTRFSTLNYRIEARLFIEKAPSVVFETLIEFATGQTLIEEARVE